MRGKLGLRAGESVNHLLYLYYQSTSLHIVPILSMHEADMRSRFEEIHFGGNDKTIRSNGESMGLNQNLEDSVLICAHE